MKDFLIIGNGNAVTYKEIFPLIKENKIWLGHKSFSGGMDFIAGDTYDATKCLHLKTNDKGDTIINVMMCLWFTNIEHAKRNEVLELTKTYSNEYYPKYDNYDAIEVSKTVDIPMDYDGVMGVPITFLGKYNPDQFEIIGITYSKDKNEDIEKLRTDPKHRHVGIINGQQIYPRILIRHKR